MQKIRAILCALFGHPRYVGVVFFYVHCARCNTEVGDRLLQGYDLTDHVVTNHPDCDNCRKNYKKLKWHEKILCPRIKKQKSN